MDSLLFSFCAEMDIEMDVDLHLRNRIPYCLQKHVAYTDP